MKYCPRRRRYQKQQDCATRVQIINGPDVSLLGKHEPSIYGNVISEEYLSKLRKKYPDVELGYFQSNVEGKAIDKIQQTGFDVDGVILNAGVYTHASTALQDAIHPVSSPVIEVHISNVHARESLRRVPMIVCVCKGAICGFGLNSYRLALKASLDKQV